MLGPAADAPEQEGWEAVIERKYPDCDTIRPARIAFGVRMGSEVLWLHTATDLTAPEKRDRYRRRCQLMAAAPDLLEAAKAALEAIEVPCSHCPQRCDRECFDAACVVHKTVARIEAAVAKAKGGVAG